ncbi:MAG TPA: hypothetical protein VLS89_20105, partial [Candidatus Nanopelagicales bacterium]|nr:hypothetical protein [Candidatus Nanopelagicales bacterium]
MIRSNSRVLIQVIVAAAFGSAGLFAACTDSYRSDVAGEAGGGGTGPGSGPGGGGMGGQILTDGGTCELTCSNDLKKVINCLGAVIEECTADQGCANAQCIDNPCEAAIQSKSSYGCEFWAVKTALGANASGACFAAFVANTWEKPILITVERNGASLNVANFARIPVVQGQT